MKDRKLATRYARALLSVFTDSARAETADDFLTALSKAMNAGSEFRALLLDPAYSANSRKKVLHALIESRGLPVELKNFLSVIVDNNRTSSIPSIAEVFHQEREERIGVVPAEITTASPMSDELKQRAGAALEKLTGRTVRLTCIVEPALIGGAVTRVGSKVYDGSLRTQLAQMKQRMTQE